MARKFSLETIGNCPQDIADYTLALELALEQCVSELYSIHSQYGDKETALENSRGLLMADEALNPKEGE